MESKVRLARDTWNVTSVDRASSSALDGPTTWGRVRQVQIRNYKSIGQATVDLGNLTILVGANGAGKSNFLDALAFVSDCLSDSIELAFKNRGGLAAVRRRSGGHPTISASGSLSIYPPTPSRTTRSRLPPSVGSTSQSPASGARLVS